MQESLALKDIKWQNTVEPDNEELAQFIREANLLTIDAEFIVRNQRPELAVRSNYVLLLVHIPVFDKQLRVTSGCPLYMLITEHGISTLQYEHTMAVEKLIKDFRDNPERLSERGGNTPLSIGFTIIGELFEGAFRKVQRLGKHVEIAEDAVFQGNERKMVEEIAILTRDVLDFRKIVRPHVSLFSRTISEFSLDDTKYWDRLGNQAKRIWEALESLYESTKELRETNDSLLQHKENELLRSLTYYSIVAIPVFIFVGQYNPRAEQSTLVDHIVFWLVLGFLVVTFFTILLHSRHKRII